MHRAGSPDNLRSVCIAESLVAEAHAQQGEVGLQDHLPANPEVREPLRSTGPGGDDNCPNAVRGDEISPVCFRVVDDKRLASGNFGDELAEVEGEGVFVVDDQHLHRDHFPFGVLWDNRNRRVAAKAQPTIANSLFWIDVKLMGDTSTMNARPRDRRWSDTDRGCLPHLSDPNSGTAHN